MKVEHIMTDLHLFEEVQRLSREVTRLRYELGAIQKRVGASNSADMDIGRLLDGT